jgi:hypothetical protein
MAVSGLLEKFCKRVVISHILQTNGAPFANFLYSFYRKYFNNLLMNTQFAQHSSKLAQVFFKKEKS